MKKKKQKDPQSSFALDAALAVLNLNNYIHLDHLATLERNMISQIEKEIADSTNAHTPESLYMMKEIAEKKKKLFASLSEEAKQAIAIIADCPAEMIRICVRDQLDQVNIKRLMKLIKKQWGEARPVKQMFNEIFNFAAKIEALNNGS
jgi:hypothetical protein